MTDRNPRTGEPSDSLMARDEAWREQGLTIGRLESRVGISEYRLRRLINQRLGFRNSTAFVNDYRHSAAATRLGGPLEARIPVLAIALDLGWGSIGPFRRSLRARFSMTPSDCRRGQAAETNCEAQCRTRFRVPVERLPEPNELSNFTANIAHRTESIRCWSEEYRQIGPKDDHG